MQSTCIVCNSKGGGGGVVVCRIFKSRKSAKSLKYLILSLCFQFTKNSGKGDKENTLWCAYCAFHLGDYKSAMQVSNFVFKLKLR